MKHKAPWECIYPKEDEGICLRGDAPGSDTEYFEILCLCVLQAGLSWGAIRRNWERIRRSFLGFDPKRLARTSVSALLKRAAIKNERKVRALIQNARTFLGLVERCGSFESYVKSLKELSKKDAIKEIERTFVHISSYSASYFLHSIGFW